MTLPDRDLRECGYCGTGRAVSDFAIAEYAALARRIVWQMRRIPAAGAYDDGFHYGSRWDEFCRFVQDRPNGISAWAWKIEVSALASHLVAAMPTHVAPLLTLALAWDDTEDDTLEGQTDVFVCRDRMEQHLTALVEGIAQRQDLSRLRKHPTET